MCETLLEIMRPEVEIIAKESEKKGKEEGKEEGRAAEMVETGYEFGLSEDNILERLQKSWIYHLRRHRNTLKNMGGRPCRSKREPKADIGSYQEYRKFQRGVVLP